MSVGIIADRADELERWVAEVSGRYDQPPPRVEWAAGQESSYRTRTGPVIALDEKLLADRDVARMVAGHELGHVILGHLRYFERRFWTAVLASAITFSVILIGLIRVGTTTGLSQQWWWWVIVFTTAGGGAAQLMHWAGRRGQRYEFAADQFAAANGFGITPDIHRRHATLMPHHHQHATKADRWLWPTHPSWQQRINRCAPED